VIAFAGGRQRLSSGIRGVAGLTMLDDNFYGVPQTIAVAMDRLDRLRFVDAALAELRSSGFLGELSRAAASRGLRSRQQMHRIGNDPSITTDPERPRYLLTQALYRSYSQTDSGSIIAHGSRILLPSRDDAHE
jgi:hypothetical protein